MRNLVYVGALLVAMALGMLGAERYARSFTAHAEVCSAPGKRQPTGDGTLVCDCTVTQNDDCHCLFTAQKCPAGLE